MPLYTVDIEKRLASEFWTNRYIVQADTLNAAVIIGADFVTAERAMHSVNVEFTRRRTATLVQNDNLYTITALGVSGQRNEPTSLLPLFNTLRFDINAIAGRPSRKYFRGVLTEGDINGDALSTSFNGFLAAFVDTFGTPQDLAGWVDPQGEVFLNIAVHPRVQMRQLRRSRRRRANGGGIFQ